MERIKVKNDARLWIAEGCNRYDTQWKISRSLGVACFLVYRRPHARKRHTATIYTPPSPRRSASRMSEASSAERLRTATDALTA